MAFDYDLEQPLFVNPTHQYSRQGLDNPDASTSTPTSREGVEYVVRGRRGTTADLSFQVMGGAYTADSRRPRLDGLRRPRARRSPPTGASSSPSAPSPGCAKGATLIVREVYDDWDTEERGTLTIQRLDTPGSRATALDAASGSRRGTTSPRKMLVGRIKTWFAFPRVVHLQGAGQHPDRAAADAGRPGVAVLLDRPLRRSPTTRRMIVTVPVCDDCAVPGHPDRLALVRLHRLRAPPDLADPGPVAGRPRRQLRYVISERDPGIANWLETTGHPQGVMMLRWQRARRATSPPTDGPTVEVVPFADVAARLPHFDADQSPPRSTPPASPPARSASPEG